MYRHSFRAAFALGRQMVLVKLSFGNRAVAEVTGHIKRFSFVSGVVVQGTALRLENWQDSKRRRNLTLWQLLGPLRKAV
jgi:hypothetical protein